MDGMVQMVLPFEEEMVINCHFSFYVLVKIMEDFDTIFKL